MRTLYHWPLDPQSRQARIALDEKKLRYKLTAIDPWNISEEFLVMAPEGKPPALLEIVPGGKIIVTGAKTTPRGSPFCPASPKTAPKPAVSVAGLTVSSRMKSTLISCMSGSRRRSQAAARPIRSLYVWDVNIYSFTLITPPGF